MCMFQAVEDVPVDSTQVVLYLQAVVQAEALAGNAGGAAFPTSLMIHLSALSTSQHFTILEKYKSSHPAGP